MTNWPLYAHSAAREVNHGEGRRAEERLLAAFTERWGGVTPEALTTALPHLETLYVNPPVRAQRDMSRRGINLC